MEIIYSPHAKKRMIERGISDSDVKETLNFPEYTLTRGKEIEAYKKIKDKMLKVVYVPLNKFINIITLYYL
jgi:hypothetical protein